MARSSTICEPICALIPCHRICFVSRCARYISRASCQLTPNLCSCSPVEMCGCPPAFTSGFTRIETPWHHIASRRFLDQHFQFRPGFHIELQNPLRASPSPSVPHASRISSRVFPTPENTMRSPRTPMRPRCSSSPPDTMSNPLPRCASSFKIVKFPLDFTAKHNTCGTFPSPLSNSSNASSTARRLYTYVGVPNRSAISASFTPSQNTSFAAPRPFHAKCGVNRAGSTYSRFFRFCAGVLISPLQLPVCGRRIAARSV